jgi:hypothetical protein
MCLKTVKTNYLCMQAGQLGPILSKALFSDQEKKLNADIFISKMALRGAWTAGAWPERRSMELWPI